MEQTWEELRTGTDAGALQWEIATPCAGRTAYLQDGNLYIQVNWHGASIDPNLYAHDHEKITTRPADMWAFALSAFRSGMLVEGFAEKYPLAYENAKRICAQIEAHIRKRGSG